METENSQNVFLISITHNSKIRELSDGNRVMEIELSFGQTTFLLWVPPFLSYELWKLRIELWKHLVQTVRIPNLNTNIEMRNVEIFESQTDRSVSLNTKQNRKQNSTFSK